MGITFWAKKIKLTDRWQFCLAAIIVLLSLLAGGCAVVSPVAEQEVSDSPLAAKYRHKAIAHEKRGQLREALLSWWIVQSYYPNDAEIAGKIKKIKEETERRGADHFRQALTLYHQGALKGARREILRTLIYDPEHSRALRFLQNELHDPVFEKYTVQQGDTVRKIAAERYRDPTKAFLITSFNPHASGGGIRPGSSLRLVILDDAVPGTTKIAQKLSPPQKKISSHDYLVLAPRRQKKRIVVYATSASKVREEERPDKAKATIPNRVYYQQAKELLDREEYLEALRILRSIDRDFRDVEKLIAYTEVFLQQEADAHYRKGISYYLSENLSMAIQEWEEVLRLSPEHLKAKKDLRNARRLQRKIDTL